MHVCGKRAGVIFGAAMLLTSCAGNPRPVLEKFLDASLKANLEEAYQYVSAKDRAVRSVSEYKGTLAENPFANILANKISYSIQSVEVHGSKAVAVVKITRPDLSQAAGAVMGAAFASVFGGKDAKAAQQAVADKLSKQDLPTTTTTEKFSLVRESDGWKVYLGWENEKRLSEAARLRRDHNFQGAIAKLDDILNSDHENEEAKKARADTLQESEAFKKKEAYFDKVKLYDFNAKYYATYLEKRVPGVNFKVKNNGDRALTEVEVTVYFKNRAGDIISEENYHPVLVREISFSGDNKPLKPGYIWQMERDKFYQAKKVPDEWKEGSATAKITNIEFQ